ncbi:hypothetical protein M7I_1976 [Glarea lozoyensis 74030]|uniref:Uncharacterized protein n=1 Tax=Glarea lozoyensis (strain ATCC 74030 / MF5533) TaxID=1104152 RepID=H0EHJ5_GLAL7|nr:hypothetical protein M7I_1976 [Glarea lozoyensis 74030]
MAPTRARQSIDEGDSSGSDEDPQSQERLALERATTLQASLNKKRDTKRKSIEAEHAKSVKEIRAKIENAAKIRKTKVAKLHSSHMERLLALDDRRQKIEGLIIASMKRLHSATNNIQSELLAMYEGRTAEIEELVDISIEGPFEGR